MRVSRNLKLILAFLAAAFATAVCSGNYITPGSLEETEQAAQNIMASATALANLLSPTETPETPKATATPIARASATPLESPTAGAPYLYTAQAGDTLEVLAIRFGVDARQIASPQDISSGLITAGQIFNIPNLLAETTPNDRLLPDSEIVFSPSAIGFSAASYAGPFGGYLMNYREYLPSDWYNGPAVIERVANEQSINPRVLLSILQQQSNWVLGEPLQGADLEYPIGMKHPQQRGLYHQVTWAAAQLSIGYYGWKDGSLTELTFPDGSKYRIAPDLNAGTVAIQYLFSKLYNYDDWLELMNPETGFAFTHGKAMFPDPWARATQVEPMFPPEFEQPNLGLPFYASQTWYFTSGPHGAWGREGSMAALDFAPGSDLPGCQDSELWITAAGPGLIVRSQRGVLVVDMDGDGYEQTGWVILYLHVANKDHLRVGDWVDRGDKLGNPSCEGGNATGTHLHIARKYNGEWISAGGPVPFNLSGWVTQNGSAPYLGTLVREGNVITACTCSNQGTRIARSSSDPY
jgi:LysM repeat protein